MTRTLVLVHTVAPLVDAFAGWCRDLLPDVRTWHILDEPLLERIRARGTGAPEDESRLLEHVALAAAVGADAVLVTCSTVSRSVDAIRARSPLPVLTIDDAMAAEAVRRGGRVAVVATNPTTLAPTEATLQAAAARAGTDIQVTLRLVDLALDAVLSGDGQTHDRLVAAAVREVAATADVIVLAQASTARAMAAFADPPIPIPVLSSPHLALADVRRLLLGGTSPQHVGNQPEVAP